MTAVLNGKQVLAPPKDIAEVKNAYEIYKRLDELDPYSVDDSLAAHGFMTHGLVEESGVFLRWHTPYPQSYPCYPGGGCGLCTVPGPLQLLQGEADAVRALFADFGQASGGVVPVLRQGQHHGEQPFGFQGQPRIPQVVVGHHRVVAGFLNAKYRHSITSFRRSGKVFVFGKKTASMPLGHLGGKNLWAATFRLIVNEKTWDFHLLSVQILGK